MDRSNDTGHGEPKPEDVSSSSMHHNLNAGQQPVAPPVADAVHQLCAWDGEDASAGHALLGSMDVSAGDNCAIRFAASQGHVHVVKLLCRLERRHGVDVSARNNEALRQAACHGHVRVVALLCGLPLSRGVDPAACNNEAVIEASANGHVDVVRFLCGLPRGRGVDAAAGVNACIRRASQNGHVEVVR